MSKHLPIKVYKRQNSTAVGRLLKDTLKDLWGSHFLAWQLAKRDISAQYRQSYLGILWLFITPVASALIWIILKSSGTVAIADTGMPYPVYAFSGTLIWSILLESINSPTQSTNASRNILTKINFPKEALVLSGVHKLLFNSSVKVILLILFVFVFGVGFHWSLLLVPFALLGAVMVGTALGLLLTPIGLLYNDISRLTTMGLSLIMYLTPVVYGIPKSGIMKTVMTYNPFTPLITTTRALAVGDVPEQWVYYSILMVVGLLLLIFSLMIYRRAIPVIVERLSA